MVVISDRKQYLYVSLELGKFAKVSVVSKYFLSRHSGAPCRRREDLGDFQNFRENIRKSRLWKCQKIKKIENIFLEKYFFDSVGHIKTWIPELAGVFLDCENGGSNRGGVVEKPGGEKHKF